MAVVLYYFQTNIFCMMILFVIFLSVRSRKEALPARRAAFSRLLLIIGIICISDIFADSYVGQSGPEAGAVLQISNIVYYAAITWAGYAWLNYVEIRIKSLDYNHKKRKLLSSLPLIVILLLLITNPLTSFMFSVDENNIYARGDGVLLHWALSWFYLVYAAVEVVIGMNKASTKAEKEQLRPMLWFIVPPAVAAVVQMLFYGVTSTQCGMTLAAMIIAINFMAEEVLRDTLTGLNNRRALESTLIERLKKSSSKVTVLMCDIDKFKTINDTLGHAAGDFVLKRVAEVLKTVCTEWSSPLLLCRYGGDEFVVCGSDMDADEVSRLIAAIEDGIANVDVEYARCEGFGISIGQANGICSDYDDVAALISMADAVMYERKQAKAGVAQS